MSLEGPVVRIITLRNPLDPGDRESSVEAWAGQSLRDLIPARLAHFSYLRILRDGVEIPSECWDDARVAPGAIVEVIPLPGGFAVGIFNAASAIFLSAAGAATVVGKIFAPPKPSATPRIEESPTYGWSGIRTEYQANGQPLPAILGEHLVGGMVIGQYVESALEVDSNDAVVGVTSTLHLLLALGHGPVHSIGGYETDQDDLQPGSLPVGMKIEGNTADNFSNVFVSLRLGNANQSHIPGFESVRTFFTVGQVVGNETVASGNPVVTDWSQAVSYDMTVEGDSCVVGLLFAGGLFRISGSTLASQDVEVEVRYQELDGGGSPIGPIVTPLFFEDGTSNPVTISGKIQGEFARFLPMTLADPSTYTPASLGQAMECNFGFLATTNLNGLNNGFTVGESVNAFTCVVNAVYTQGAAESTPAGDDRVVWSWIQSSVGTDANGSYNITSPTAGTLRGFAVKLYDTNGGATADTVGIEVELGHGQDGGTNARGEEFGWNRFTANSIFTISSGASQNLQIVLTYREIGSERRLRVYVNGALVITRTTLGSGGGTNDVPRVNSPQTDPAFRLATANQMLTGRSGLRYDEVRLYRREWTSGDVSSAWNGGTPTQGATSGPGSAFIMALWSMNAADATGLTGAGTDVSPYTAGTFTDLSGNGLDLDISGSGGVVSHAGFVLDGNEVKVPKASKYRIQVQRRTLVAEGVDRRDELTFQSLTVVEDEELEYPETALLGLRIQADEQIDTQRPEVLVPVKGLLAPIWDGVNRTSPNTPLAWTSNPAWLTALTLTARWGMGATFSLADIDWPSFGLWADWCDELLYDQRSTFTVKRLEYGTWTSGSDLDTLYPDGFLEIVSDFPFSASTLPPHMLVGYLIKLVGTDTSGHAWAQDILDVASYEIVEREVAADTTADAIRVPWPSSVVAVPPSPTSWTTGSDTVTCEGRETRMSADLVLDRSTETGWDQVAKVANAGRGSIVKVGRKIRARYAAARSPVAMFTSANIKEGTYSFQSVSSSRRFNSASAEILDRARNYEREPVQDAHPTANDGTTTVNLRHKAFSFEGVTRRSQAKRELRVLLNVSHLLLEEISFTALPDAAFVEPGDVIYVAHDLPLWAYSGAAYAGSPSTSTVILDREVTMAAATTYYLAVRNGQTDEIEVRQVTTGSGTYGAGSLITVSSAFSFTPADGDLWTLGARTTATKLFEVLDTDQDPMTFETEIRALEYDADAYEDATFPELDDPVSELDVPTDQQAPSPPLAVVVGDGSGTDAATGAFASRIEVSWQLASGEVGLVREVAVWLATCDMSGAVTEAFRQVAVVRGTAARQATVAGPDVVVGSTYCVKVQPIGRSGARPALGRLAGHHVRLEGRSDLLVAPSSVVGYVRGGKASYRLGARAAGSRAGSVEIRRGGWVLGDPVVSIGAQAGEADAGANWIRLPAAADGRQDPPLWARIRYENGQVGDAILGSMDFDLSDFEDPALEESIEDAGWTAGSTPALTNLQVISAENALAWDTTALSASYVTRDFVMGDARAVHVSFGWEAEQRHPRPWDPKAVFSGGLPVYDDTQYGVPHPGSVTGGGAISSREDQWGSRLSKSWSWEGPLDDLHTDATWRESSNVAMVVEMAYSTTSSPGSGWVAYRPGVYKLRSVKFRISFERATSGYDVRLTRAAVALREPIEIIDGGTF